MVKPVSSASKNPTAVGGKSSAQTQSVSVNPLNRNASAKQVNADVEMRSQGGLSRGSNLSSRLSQSLRNTLDKSGGKSGNAAALKVQEMLRKQ